MDDLTGTIDPADSNRKRDSDPSAVSLVLLKAKLEEREKLHGDYFRATSIVIVVLGLCVKFSIDQTVQTRFQSVLPLAGLLITVGFLAEVWMGNLARKAIETEIAELMRRVDDSLPRSESPRLKYALIGFGYGGLVFLAVFVYVLALSP